MPTYLTPSAPVQFHNDPIKGSRFIADVIPVTSREDAMSCIRDIQTTSPDATHHCWAWRLHAEGHTRSSDDGEPSGSAGRPILAQIEGHDFFDLVVIVTRYYGGTKLGVGGLMRAYGGTAGKALDQVEQVSIEETTFLQIQFEYPLTKAIEAVLREQSVTAVETKFEADVSMRLQVSVDTLHILREALIQNTSGKIRFPSTSKPLP